MSNKRGFLFHGIAGLSLSAALVALVGLSSPTGVKAQSIPEVVYAYAKARPVSSAPVTQSFQRDGMIADIFVKAGDQFKQRGRLLEFGAIGSIKDSEFLTAPFDGEVAAISVNKGDRVSAGAPLMTLRRHGHVILIAEIEPDALTRVLTKLKRDQLVQLTPLSSDCKPGESKVQRIGVVDPKTSLVPFFIELPEGMWGCGEDFKVGIEVGK